VCVSILCITNILCTKIISTVLIFCTLLEMTQLCRAKATLDTLQFFSYFLPIDVYFTEMSDDENDIINDREHDALLRDLRHLDKPHKRKGAVIAKPAKKKVTFDKAAVLDDLVGAITSTK
jgi:hypothetical protein